MRRGFLLLSVVLVACGPTPAEPAQAGGGDSASPAALPPGAWQQMTKAERSRHMKKVVLPRMGEVFRRYDDERFADMDCATCHVDGLSEGSFAMPDPGLPRLESYDAAKRDDLVAVTFMEVVEQEMANALGVDVYDPVTHQGFKCASCHVMGSAGAADPLKTAAMTVNRCRSPRVRCGSVDAVEAVGVWRSTCSLVRACAAHGIAAER